MTQKNRTTLGSDFDANLADNFTGDISAADIRDALKDLSDSSFNFLTDAPSGLTLGGLTLTDANIGLGTISGTKLGTSTLQKLGFYNSTPIVQPANTSAMDTLMVNLGLRASGGVAGFATTIKPRTGGTLSGSEPLQFTSASLLASPTAGTLEFLTDKYYATITTGTARKEFSLNDQALTSGRVPFATINGRLTDSANFTFLTSTLTLGVSGSTLGALKLTGSTAGAATIQTGASTGTYNFILPNSIGNSGLPLLSGGSSNPHTYGMLGLAAGGTNNATYSSNGVVYYDSGISGLKSTSGGSNTQVLHGGTSGAPVFGSVNLNYGGDCTGTLQIINGGTGTTSVTSNGIVYGGSGGGSFAATSSAVTAALVTNNGGIPGLTSGATANRVLRTNGTAITFSQVALTTDVSGTLPVANGGTNATSFGANRVVYMNSGNTALTSVAGFIFNGTKLGLSAATTSNATVNIPPGTAPTTPSDGDLWYDGTDLKFQVGGTTKTVTLI